MEASSSPSFSESESETLFLKYDLYMFTGIQKGQISYSVLGRYGDVIFIILF